MAAAIKGEVSFKAAGQTWTMVYDFNALCAIEEELGVDFDDLANKLSSPTMIRSVFRIGLSANHGALSDIDAGRLIHDLSALEATQLIVQAFKSAFPEAAAGNEVAEGKAKPKSRGTGRKP